jgi:hypothetical protein
MSQALSVSYVAGETVYLIGKIPNHTDVGAAPAGHGLGETVAKPLGSGSDLNNIRGAGWYKWSDSVPANAPSFAGGNTYGYMRVDCGDANTCTQTIWSGRSAAKGIHVRREITGGTVGEWEYENPPLTVGVEYRTTERLDGKPVYVKAIEIPLTTSGYKKVKIASGMTEVKSIEIVTYGKLDMGYYHYGLKDIEVYGCEVNLGDGNFQINTAQHSSLTVKAIIKYCRS